MAYWILQGKPETYDTSGALDAGIIDRWRVRRNLSRISPGDEFALWVSGPGGGVVALGTVTESPEHDTDPDPFWVDSAEGAELAWRIGIRISRQLTTPVQRTALLADPRFARSAIIRMLGGGNPFPVTPDEWLALQSHIAHSQTGSLPDGPSQSATPEDIVTLLSDRQAIDDLNNYFGTSAITEPPGFTGSRFNTLDGGGTRPEVRDKVTAADLIAVQCLGITIRASTCLELLEGHPGVTLSAYLRHIPSEIALGDSEAIDHVQPDSAADLAWHFLTQQYGIDWVIAGKLLARKRPELIPVYDQVVRCAIGRPDNPWLWFDDLLRQNDTIADRLAQLHGDARLPALVPRLRVLDVVIWMRHREHHEARGCPGIIG
jgi:hypothetical protein